MGVVGGDVPDFVTKREGKLGLVVHDRHQLPRDVDVAARDGKSVLDRRVEGREMQRLAGIGDSRESADAAADRFHISCARSGFGAAELLDDLRTLPLRLGNVAGIEIAELLLLRCGGCERHRGCGKQEDASTHDHPSVGA